MSQWNEQQKQAINAKERSIIVSAAAGSGKTSVLIERLIRIISDRENPVHVEKMVVVTFTNAAAAEMRQRLSAALAKKLESNQSDGWLLRQQAFLGSASISTIHSFCFNLIRENTAGLSLGSDFRVLEDSEQKLMADAVLKEYIDELYETSPGKIMLLRDNFCGNTDDQLVKIILELHGKITAIPFFENWLDRCSEFYDNPAANEKEYSEITAGELRKLRSTFLKVMEQADGFGEEKLTNTLNNDMAVIEQASDILEQSGYIAMADYLESEKAKFADFPRAKKDIDYREERNNVRDTRKSIINRVKALAGDRIIIANSADDHEKHKKIMAVISEIVCEFDRRLYERRLEENALSFDDAECIALKLLAECDKNGKINKTPLAHELSEHYELIMVDEFQDSNDRQDMIFRLLSRNGNENEYGNNLFFVGDVKQSIYRFRQANPDNFINVMKRFVPYKENDDSNAYIKLSCNYRSSQQVIDFVNYIFRNIMSEQAGDISYNEDEFLINGASFPECDRTTTVMMIDKDRKKSDINAEALCIAAKIRKMIDENTMVSDGKGGLRQCCEKDFCILMRNKTLTSVYEEALDKYGLSANCENLSGYLKSREISVLLNILRIVDNPMQDIALTSVLMSPMFMVTADEMVQIRLVNRFTRLYNNISLILGKYKISETAELEETAGIEKKKSEEPDLSAFTQDSVIYKKLESFYSLITELRMISSFSSLPELIQIIYDRTDFTSVISLYKDSERKRANLRILLEYANSFEAVSSGGAGGFIRYVDRISESKGDFASVSTDSSSRNAVSVMTIHKSKGLEFPFVFMAETSTGFNREDEKAQYQFSSDKGIGFKLQNKEKLERFSTIPCELVKRYNRKKMLGEEMRLLYVALTRAKERLFIPLDVSEKAAEKAQGFANDIYSNSGITPNLVLSAESMRDWLLMALVSFSKAALLRERLGINECFRYSDDFPIYFEDAAPSDDYQEIEDTPKEAAVIDEETVISLRKAFAFKYDDSLVDVVSKLSVSDISKNDDTQLYTPLSAPAFMRDEEMTGAERGTAVHTFLQFADFSLMEENFEAEKNRMIDCGHITEKQGTVIEKSDIDAFLSSELYKEIKSAKKVMREKKFLISIDDLALGDEFSESYKGTDGMLGGIMDMVIEKEDCVILVDYKTDKVSSTQELVRKYSHQLLLYKKALEKIQEKPVKSALIYSFCKKAVVTVF